MDLACCNLCNVAPKHTCKDHGKPGACDLQRGISNKDATGGFALPIQLSMLVKITAPAMKKLNSRKIIPTMDMAFTDENTQASTEPRTRNKIKMIVKYFLTKVATATPWAMWVRLQVR